MFGPREIFFVAQHVVHRQKALERGPGALFVLALRVERSAPIWFAHREVPVGERRGGLFGGLFINVVAKEFIRQNQRRDIKTFGGRARFPVVLQHAIRGGERGRFQKRFPLRRIVNLVFARRLDRLREVVHTLAHRNRVAYITPRRVRRLEFDGKTGFRYRRRRQKVERALHDVANPGAVRVAFPFRVKRDQNVFKFLKRKA